MKIAVLITFLLEKGKPDAVKKRPKFGSGKGVFIMHADFTEPLDDFKEFV